jgi:cell fate (sporulation/competence/biofilm development) regulator YmcA (YheA/YmcA/DUF963 family)
MIPFEPISLLAKLPAQEAVSLVTTLINHTEKMDQIKREYRYKKRELELQYQYAVKQLENDMKKFQKMAENYQNHFQQAHMERMKILDLIQNMTNKPLSENSIKLIDTLLNHYMNNLNRFDTTPPLLYSATKLSYKGDA